MFQLGTPSRTPAVSCPEAACGQQLQREGPSQTTVSYATSKRPYSKFPLPAEWTAISFYPSLLQTPQAHIKSLVLPLAAGFFQERGSTLQALDLFPPPPTSSKLSKVADREVRKEAWGQVEGMGLGSGNEEQECGQQHYRHEAGAPWWGAKRPENSRPEAKDPFLLCLGT